MNKRSTKFYRKNEAEVMKDLGLTPTKNSGAGWIEKEDGQNDYIIAQLKSTDKQSIRIDQKDLNILECNAIIAHKIPIFVIQFLNINQIYVLAKPEDLPNISEYLECGQTDIKTSIIEELKKEDYKELPEVETEEIKSSPESREAFYKQREEMYKNWKK